MSDRRALLARLAPVLLLLLLGVAVVAGRDLGLRLPASDGTASDEMRAAFDDLSEDPVVLVGFDPDIGTYAEIRPTVRAVVADLLARGATLAVVSVTPEGRALALAELERMDRLETNPRQVVDLGFLPGAEAALVGLAREVTGAGEIVTVDPPDGEVGEIDLGLVIGGIDLGPRSWVEQVRPRIDGLRLVAVAPTVLLPELLPYRASGQLDALLATPRDGATYRASVDLGRLERLVEAGRGPSPLAMIVGLLLALLLLGQSLGARLRNAVRTTRSREPA